MSTLLLLGVGQAPEAVEDPGPRHSEARGGPAGQVAHGLAREDLGDKETGSCTEVTDKSSKYEKVNMYELEKAGQGNNEYAVLALPNKLSQ